MLMEKVVFQLAFVVTQSEKSKASLDILQKYFMCGKIYINKRYDNHTENIYRYCVRNRKELTEIIIPFFQKHELKTAKKDDFNFFVRIIDMMNRNLHTSESGLRQIAQIVEKMNRRKNSMFLESSETER